MLNAQDIRELSDSDITREISKSRDLLYRQKMGLATGHLTDSHLVGQLKTFIARLLTITKQRATKGEAVEKSSSEASKKLDTAHAGLAKKQAGAKKNATKTTTKPATEQIEDKSDGDVKVKKVEKKSLISKITGKSKES